VQSGAPNLRGVRRGNLRSDHEQSESLYRLRASICRALGHPRRLEILELLYSGERSNAELLAALGISKVNLSQHLSVMRNAGLVESRQQGREVFHRLAFEEIREACRMIGELLSLRLERGSRLARDLDEIAVARRRV